MSFDLFQSDCVSDTGHGLRPVARAGLRHFYQFENIEKFFETKGFEYPSVDIGGAHFRSYLGLTHPGHDQDFCIREIGLNESGQLATVQLRHAEFADNEIEWHVRETVDRRLATICAADTAAEGLEHHRDDFEDGDVVVDNQHP